MAVDPDDKHPIDGSAKSSTHSLEVVSDAKKQTKKPGYRDGTIDVSLTDGIDVYARASSSGSGASRKYSCQDTRVVCVCEPAHF